MVKQWIRWTKAMFSCIFITAYMQLETHYNYNINFPERQLAKPLVPNTVSCISLLFHWTQLAKYLVYSFECIKLSWRLAALQVSSVAYHQVADDGWAVLTPTYCRAGYVNNIACLPWRSVHYISLCGWGHSKPVSEKYILMLYRADT